MVDDLHDKGRPSWRYQDYVIKNGILVAEFEAMYQHAAEVPWHQDKTAYALYCDFDLAILRHFHESAHWRRVIDVGCGLGYLTSRLKEHISGAEVHGVDISQTAIKQAAQLHPDIVFHARDFRKPDADVLGRYDLIFVKDLLWYVLPELATVVANLSALLQEGGWPYVSQSVPGLPEFYGRDLFPNPAAILDFFANRLETRYASSTYERCARRIVGVYDIDKYARFLGQARALATGP